MDDMTIAGRETGNDPARKAPGRPRDARADDVIMDALIELLSEGQSADAVSVEAVAARAGVGKATIYRRWPNKEALLIDAAARLKGPPPQLTGVSVRDDLIAMIAHSAAKKHERHSRAAACLFPEVARNEALKSVFQAIQEPRRKLFRDVLRRGVATGELRPDLDIELTMLLLTAPSMAQNLVNLNPEVKREGFAEALVDLILTGAAGPRAA